ncbi:MULTISPECIES: MFS transporter [Microbacterium]|uniref:MFS transporter n=1 Tax=Microbacterium TaxID=33882 RepID=UPI001C613874|nr:MULTISPECIES: MFS transporter [unclassified Microbacterium]
MSSVSGAAAGNPSGMTSASRTLGSGGHHWFAEPTEPAKKSYVTWLIIAQFVFFIALLGPAIVGVGLKITSLQAAGAIAEGAAAANSASAILGGVGAFFAAIANVTFGRISDRTTSKWGRRRIWIVLGAVIMTIGFVFMALGDSLAIATVGWAIAQLGANMTLAPFVATIADQVPKFQRGSITAGLGIAQNLGIVGGVYVAGWFSFSLFIVFVIPAILSIIALLIFVIVLPDKQLPVKPTRITFREILGTIWVSPAKHPDFALAWWSRFLITFAAFGFTTFRFFYMQYHLSVPVEEVGLLIANTTLVYTGALVVTAWIAGKVSDRIGRRKVFVWTSTALFAVGTLALIFIQDVPSYYVLELFLGAAYGIYVGVDLALVVDVLPNPDDAGKDLGVLNLANALPQTAAPLVGGLVMAAFGGAAGSDYSVWFTICAIAALIGALVIFPIKSVR